MSMYLEIIEMLVVKKIECIIELHAVYKTALIIITEIVFRHFVFYILM